MYANSYIMDNRKQAPTLFHSWGTAKILYSDTTVTAKELQFIGLCKTSLHYHLRRRETLYVQSGTFTIHVYDTEKEVIESFPLNPGMSYTVPRGGIHQIECTSHGIIIETSLTYEEEDVVRIFDESLLKRGPSMR
jgi:mannose-6-phosphate isomerase-like protein (cupin superfamily)